MNDGRRSNGPGGANGNHLFGGFRPGDGQRGSWEDFENVPGAHRQENRAEPPRNDGQENQVMRGGFGCSNQDIARIAGVNARNRRGGYVPRAMDVHGRQNNYGQQREPNVPVRGFEEQPPNLGELLQNENRGLVLPPVNLPAMLAPANLPPMLHPFDLPMVGGNPQQMNGNRGLVLPPVNLPAMQPEANLPPMLPPPNLPMVGDGFQQNQHLRCTRCGRNGHVATGCYRNADGSMRNIHHRNDMRCYSCNFGGHLARDCPRLRNNFAPQPSLSEVTVISGGSCTSSEASPPLSPMSTDQYEGERENNDGNLGPNYRRQGLRLVCEMLKDAQVRAELSRSDPDLLEAMLSYVLHYVEI